MESCNFKGEQGIEDGDEQEFPGHLLHQAALWDNQELLIDLLNGEAKGWLNSQDSWGRTPLHAAATTENSHCLDILLATGANPNVRSGAQDNFKSPLHTSAEHGYLSNVTRLIEGGADVHQVEGQGLSSLDLAQRGGHTTTAAFLVQVLNLQEERRAGYHRSLRDASSSSTPNIQLVQNILKEIESQMSAADMASIINLTPNGTNSLLFKACECGNLNLVRILIEAGAGGRIHPVTKYSPLYISAYYGHKDIVLLLLQTFPLLVQVPTVEKWLPLHAACINGHAHILEIILKFDYATTMLQSFRAPTNSTLHYKMAFDINMKDVSGQTALYIACQMGNQRLVDTILKHRVIGLGIDEDGEDIKTKIKLDSCKEEKLNFSLEPSPKSSPTKKFVSEGIQGILSKLSLATNQNLLPSTGGPKKLENWICPVDVNTYCEEYQTALHVAVKLRHHVIASSLLLAKADPNLVILPAPSQHGISPYIQVQREKRREDSSTALIEACLTRDLGMIDLLLKHGARDDEGKALLIVRKDDVIVGKILALKAHLDSENRVNTSYLKQTTLSGISLASSILPTTPVTINWHAQHLDKISDQWLISCALKLNPRLRLCLKNSSIGLQSITRLDLSSNALEYIPSTLFTLSSLVYLNLSQNKLQKLHFPSIVSTPVLEEILLQENRFEICPTELFTHFPSLKSLNLSNNKLQYLPPTMWQTIKLQELNVSLNLLKNLPSMRDDEGQMSSMDTSQFESLPYIPLTSTTTTGTGTTLVPLSPEGLTLPSLIPSSLLSSRDLILSERRNNSSHLMTHHARWRTELTIVNVTIEEGTTTKFKNFIDKKDEDQNTTTTVHSSSIIFLNLSHNSFLKIPKVLACLGTNLQRLNLSYNSLRVMGHIGDYPSSLRQLDLSHNGIERWFYPPPPDHGLGFGGICHSNTNPINFDDTEGSSTTTTTTCKHRIHSRLENLKTLMLSGNKLQKVVVSPEEITGSTATTITTTTATTNNNNNIGGIKSLWYPNLTMLDLSENNLIEITIRICELSGLSVLNLSGNVDINELPPEMGLLSRMWNLNLTCCPNLQEPLKNMIERQRCKTMDIIGYLKSVLEDAKPYCRMKLMIVGVTGIGKTSLLSQLKQEGTSSSGARHTFQEQDHWARRMSSGSSNSTSSNSSGGAGGGSSSGHKSINHHQVHSRNRKGFISTVGVDIGSWIHEVKPHRGGGGGHGPVLFRTWDFGGQREYYATHLYFLSKRSLYLVVWNICDGEKGLNEIYQWLVNIQARAPNSPVIIVGTHFDLVSEKFPPGYLDYLQQKIRDKLICVSDPEKRGLPRVLYSVEISCKTRHNIRHLSHLIYDTVFNLKTSNGKHLLEQKIPSKYIHLEQIITYLANERKSLGLDPVLTESEFKDKATHWLDKGFNLTFRDDAEIMQACSFLHENGILLHYEDSTLRDLYFLDPQWLCDMLAHVVTIREINPFVKNGIMKVVDLIQLFKGRSSTTREYVLSLLSKFELAVAWNESHLLIPSLLPTYEQMRLGQSEVKVNIPVRSRTTILKNRGQINSYHQENSSGADHLIKGNRYSISRFILISYFPSGFWPRLISRILSDDRIVDIVRSYFIVPPSEQVTPEVIQILNQKAEWSCWQSGIELSYGQIILLRVKEVTGEKPFAFMLRRDDTALCETDISEEALLANYCNEPEEQVWDVVDLGESGLLEIQLPALSITFPSNEITSDRIILAPSTESLSKLLALVVDHVDTLLEDWYPSIGTRFIHTSEGKYLVTRLIPCPRCFPNEECSTPGSNPMSTMESDDSFRHLTPPTTPRMSSDSGVGHSPRSTLESSCSSTMMMTTMGGGGSGNEGIIGDEGPSVTLLRTRGGIAFETPKFSGSSSYTSGLNYFLKAENRMRPLTRNMYSWSVEYCILETQRWTHRQKSKLGRIGISHNNVGGGDVNDITVKCPKHGHIPLRDIAPDVLFLDLNTRYLLKSTDVQHDKLLGRGAFGFVFSGKLIPKFDTKSIDVAIKMFQPVDPGPSPENGDAQLAFKVAQSKWLRAPAQSACRAYVAARGEVRVLYWVVHPNVVPFLGLCQSPLSIVMPKAPRGALDTVLSDFKRSGDKVHEETIRLTLLQVAKALEYLHDHRIIYRDLKSENVLAWNFPIPFASSNLDLTVDVKLADYGISRSSFPTGSKGFGGTEGFMAPEIIRYNGEEEYTDKVDIFSFGMLLFEMMSLKQPFEGCENVKESILEGDRPSLSQRDCSLYSMYMLDLMLMCWSHAPKDRPSASQIVNIVSTPDFTLLRDVVSMGSVSNVVAAVGLQYGVEKEIWLSCSTGGIYSLKLNTPETLGDDHHFQSCHCFEFIEGVVTAICIVEEYIWMGDTLSKLHAFTISNYNKIFEKDLEIQVDPGPCGAIIALTFINPIVGVGTSSGRLFLVNKKTGDLVTELGQSTLIHCLCSRPTTTTTSTSDDVVVMELWAGEKSGQMSIFKIKYGVVISQEIINHYEIPLHLEAVQVLLLQVQPEIYDFLFSYVYPGSVIYGWAGEKREMISRLDVGKLSPLRDSIDTEEGLMNKPLQVTVLYSTLEQVFVGTNWGFVILADVKNLHPLTLLRPFNEDVRSFWIFDEFIQENIIEDHSSSGGTDIIDNNRPSSSTSSYDGGMKRQAQLVIGIGKGFSSLLEEGHNKERKIEILGGRRRAFALLWVVDEKRSWM